MENNLFALARPEIIAMHAYRSARSEQNEGKIWLDANENPVDSVEGQRYNRYPEPQPDRLIRIFSKLYRVKPEQILITRGSDEGIDLLIRLFCRAYQDQILICPPTYGMYAVAANIQAAGVVIVPLLKAENFSLDLPKILATWQPNIKLIFLCSPNNPTGNCLALADILSLCEKLNNKAMIVVDEAYIEFANSPSMTTYLNTYPNLIILRTLSKAYGLAGIRCGVTLAHFEIVQLLRKIIAPYPISKPIIDVVCQKLVAENMQVQVEIIQQEKIKLIKFLQNLNFVKKIWPSDANFLLFEVDDAKKIMCFCQQHGIVLRDRSHEYGLENCVRVTIGTPDENQTLREVLQRV